MKEFGTLFGKLAQIMSEFSRIPKHGENKFHRYTYATNDDILDAVRNAMSRHGVALLPDVSNVERIGGETRKGEPQTLTIVTMEFTFACGESGETWTCAWQGESIDTSDKGLSKAITAAEKYFLMKTFLLSAGDDVDADEQSPEAVKVPAAPVVSLVDQLDRLLINVNDRLPENLHYRHPAHMKNTLRKDHDGFLDWPDSVKRADAEAWIVTLVKHQMDKMQQETPQLEEVPV